MDNHLLEIARGEIVQAARRSGITLKQTYAREGKKVRRKAGGYAHARQFRRMRKLLNANARSLVSCCGRSSETSMEIH